ncbi:DUF3618 domain-containing protein [Actinocatenispora rupis]|uniref:DUF3618 domain-containing protein n=1 Tax=Actinocatenispora rupis TaxID=519421 RepID=UPI00194592D0|nr:DUF3618 domain-containing protein [Actinocatenispora rupis]
MTPEQIRERMADTRRSMENNLDRLREAANPRTMLTRQLAAARHKRAGGRTPLPAGGASSADDGERGNPARAAVDAVRHQIGARPIVAGLAALLIGAVTAVLVPGPRRR